MFLVGFFANPFSSHVLKRCICHQGYYSIKLMMYIYINFTVAWWVMIKISLNTQTRYFLEQVTFLHTCNLSVAPCTIIPIAIYLCTVNTG